MKSHVTQHSQAGRERLVFLEVIAADEQSMIIAFVFPAQPGFEKRHQLLRIMKGPQDLHRISYTVKQDQPTAETQRKWLAIFQAAKLVPVANNSSSTRPSR